MRVAPPTKIISSISPGLPISHQRRARAIVRRSAASKGRHQTRERFLRRSGTVSVFHQTDRSDSGDTDGRSSLRRRVYVWPFHHSLRKNRATPQRVIQLGEFPNERFSDASTSDTIRVGEILHREANSPHGLDEFPTCLRTPPITVTVERPATKGRWTTMFLFIVTIMETKRVPPAVRLVLIHPRGHLSPAISPANRVACLGVIILKYAGTVITASVTSTTERLRSVVFFERAEHEAAQFMGR